MQAGRPMRPVPPPAAQVPLGQPAGLHSLGIPGLVPPSTTGQVPVGQTVEELQSLLSWSTGYSDESPRKVRGRPQTDPKPDPDRSNLILQAILGRV